MHQTPSSPQPTSLITSLKPFLCGSLAGCVATSTIQPIDTVKVLIQAKKQDAGRTTVNLSPFSIAKDVVQRNGIKGLYKGLDAAVVRQFIYSGARLGFYKQAEDRIKDKENRNMTIWEKAVWSLFAGGIGSLVTTPTDVALIRLQNDNNLPEEKRRNYKNVFDALGRIYREEGVKGMWTGATPTVIRAMAINCSMLVSYNSTKENLMKLFNTKEETLKIRLLSSAVCGVAITTVSLPFDNIKTKLMRMKKDQNGIYPYSGFIDCFRKSIRNQGFFALWVGITTYYTRIAPHAIITVLVHDFVHDSFKKHGY